MTIRISGTAALAPAAGWRIDSNPVPLLANWTSKIGEATLVQEEDGSITAQCHVYKGAGEQLLSVDALCLVGSISLGSPTPAHAVTAYLCADRFWPRYRLDECTDEALARRIRTLLGSGNTVRDLALQLETRLDEQKRIEQDSWHNALVSLIKREGIDKRMNLPPQQIAGYLVDSLLIVEKFFARLSTPKEQT